MSKIKKISLTNFKNISKIEADFNGCTAIITGGNNKGKSSLLKGITDRIRFIRPDVMVKNGESEGNGELTLTSGERFTWEFSTDGKDKLSYWSNDNIKSSITKEFCAKFFPPLFDIDKFLQSSPKEQVKQLQLIIGIDFSEIDIRYQAAYNDRTEKNRDAEKFHAKLSQMDVPEKVAPVSITELTTQRDAERTRLNTLYLENKAKNDVMRNTWIAQCNEIQINIRQFNEVQSARTVSFNKANDSLFGLQSIGYSGHEVSLFIESLKKQIEPQKEYIEPAQPQYIEERPSDELLQEIDRKLFEASEINAAAKVYSDFIAYKAEVSSAKGAADLADQVVKQIESERLEMIRNANFPNGIEIRTDGIYVDGFLLDRNQISQSKLYCAALRIASINLGEVKTLHFDASALDKNTLAEIQEWASLHDLQLLIERPDFEGGEIEYQILEN